VFRNGLFIATTALRQRHLAIIDPGVCGRSVEQRSGWKADLLGHCHSAQDGVIPGKSVDKNQFFAQAGREHFDGNGGMSGIYSGNFNGTIIRGSYSGTYTMKANCSGTVTFTDNARQVYNYDIFATQGGSEFVFVQTDSNSITSAYQRRRAAQ